MAICTKLTTGFMELKTGIRAMGVMTLVAIFLHRIMDELHGKFLLPVLMALEADLTFIRGGNEQIFMLACMGLVAGNTITGAHRSMAMTLGENFGLMTGKAKAAHTGTIAPQLKAHGRLMGVMARNTSFLNRNMDLPLVKLFLFGLMADSAKVLAGTGHGHLIVRSVGIMTGYTDAGTNGSMYMGAFAKIGMAATGGTIGFSWNISLEIKLAAPLFMTFFTT